MARRAFARRATRYVTGSGLLLQLDAEEHLVALRSTKRGCLMLEAEGKPGRITVDYVAQLGVDGSPGAATGNFRRRLLNAEQRLEFANPSFGRQVAREGEVRDLLVL